MTAHHHISPTTPPRPPLCNLADTARYLQVEWLLSLVQSLKKVILDLHLDPKAYPDAPLADESGAQIKGSASSAFLNLQAEKYVEEERDCSDDTDSSRSGGGHTPYEWGGRQEIASRRLQFLLSRLQMLLGLSSKVCGPPSPSLTFKASCAASLPDLLPPPPFAIPITF